MNKLNLGNDFTDEEGTAPPDGEKEEKKPEESGDESEDSADTSDSENLKDADESDSIDGDDSTKDDTVVVPEKKPDKTPEDKVEPPQDKAAVLQGLLDTEKDLDKSTGDVDTAIAAARHRISQKRSERREKREIVSTIDSNFPDTEGEKDDLSDIDADTIKVLERFTRAKGLVPKSELNRLTYNNQHSNAEDAFYAAHPEYNVDNDPDNILYDALNREVKLFAPPSDAKLIPKLFEKAHSEVIKLYPDKFKAKKQVVDSTKDDINKSVRLKTAGLGGKSSGGASSSDTSGSEGKRVWSPIQIDALRRGGWSEEEIKRLTK